MKYHCLHRRFTYGMMGGRQAPVSPVRVSFGLMSYSDSSNKRPSGRDPSFPDKGQVGSLAGAAYLLNNNAGVLSKAQCEQKSHVEYKDKSLVDCDIQ